MDQYLDECLDEELDNDVREEGPTPPKVNKGGEHLSMGYNSSKYGQLYIVIFIENIFLTPRNFLETILNFADIVRL